MSERYYEPTLPFYEPVERDRFQRLEIIQTIDGFLPASKPEQVEAMSLHSFPPKIGGAAKHLSEVVTQQRKFNVTDPMAAARAIARGYIDWAKDAHRSGHALSSLDAKLQEVYNPELVLERVVSYDEPGLVELLRFYELSMLRHNKEQAIKEIGYDPQRISYTPENGGLIPYLMQATDSWRVHQVKKMLPMSRQSEANRFNFWAERMSEVAKHYPKLKGVAQDGFDEIYGRSKEQ